MPGPHLRHSARALIVDPVGRVLLFRSVLPDGLSLWFTPGGGVDPGESALQALHRELAEETGLVLDADPPHVWRQRVVARDHMPGFDGVVNDYFLVRAPAFDPAGTFSPAKLLAEDLHEHRWWSSAEIAAYQGDAVFGPRDLPGLLVTLLQEGPPGEPLLIGI